MTDAARPAAADGAYVLAAGLGVVGLAHVGVQLGAGGPWTGPVKWRKPATFGLSFGLTLATVAWVSALAAVCQHRRAVLLRAFGAASAVEVSVITVQAWRGVPSHFNTTTPVNAALAYTAAAGGAVLVAATVLLLATAGRPGPRVSPSMRLALRVGVASFAAAVLTGAAMIALGVTAGRAGSLVDAYAAAAPLKPAHGTLMHGILVLPGLAWMSAPGGASEPRCLHTVAVASTGYLVTAAAWPAAAATAGPVRAGFLTLAALGALLLLAPGVRAAVAWFPHRPHLHPSSRSTL
ncbi:MAG: hypothetical protein JWO60_353 [Frankiales bacterium]|nr:hypothetical protein [Frankiales bacterium]